MRALFALPLLALPAAPQSGLVETAQLFAGAATASDFFGRAAAIDGDTLLIAAPNENAVGTTSGAAYVFRRQLSGAWIQTDHLIASDAMSADSFGQAVDLSGDRAIVGAHRVDGPGGINSGAAYVFERTAGGPFVEVQKLLPASALSAVEAGRAVAIDGDFAAVAAYKDDSLFNDAGKVWMFERDAAGTWHEVQALTASDASGNDDFGWDVALDGNVLVVGADRHDGITGNTTGAAYVFEHTGGVWVEVQKLAAPSPSSLDYFGHSVAVDGDRIVVGAYNDEPSGESFNVDKGAAFVFERNGAGTWQFVQELVASDAEPVDEFGYDVAIDGARVLVGAWTEDALGSSAGAAYLYTDAGGAWSEAKLLSADGQAGDLFGRVVALSGDQVVVGASNEDSQGSNAGAAYTFDLEALTAVGTSVSASAGGSQLLVLDAGHLNAGRPYLLAGSISGTSPGLPIPGPFTVPLNNDAYLLYTITNLNAPPLAGNFGLLNAAGRGFVTFALPPGSDPAYAGVTAHHAFVAIDATVGIATFVSNAQPVAITP